MKAKRATSMRLGGCDCGCRGMTFELLDGAGRVFAVADVPREVGVIVASQIVDHACPDDPIGEVAGNA